MNNRIVIGLIIALLGIALVLLFLQTQSLNQSQESLTSLQASATAAARSASAAATQAVESQAIAVADAQNMAATAQADMLALAAGNAATAQATAVSGAQSEGATAAAGTAVAQSDAFATANANAATAEARSEVLEADIAQGQAAATARSVNATAAVALTDAAVVLESAQINVATARANDATADANAAATQVAAVSTEAAVTFGNEMDVMQGQMAATQRSIQATAVAAEGSAATAIAEGDSALEAAGDKFATEQAEMQATIAVLETQVAEGGSAEGAAPGETPAPSNVDVPEDWVRLEGNGVSMALPESWLGGFLPGNRDLFNDMADAFGEDLIANVRDNQDDNGETFLFIALDTNTPINDGLTAAQVLLLTDGVTDSIAEVVDNIASDDEFWDGYDIQDTGVIELSNYEAGFIRSETDQFGIDQTQIDYYIVVDEVLYNVRFFASTREYDDGQQSVWELAVTTLEIGESK
jgi:hypothetical protein